MNILFRPIHKFQLQVARIASWDHTALSPSLTNSSAKSLNKLVSSIHLFSLSNALLPIASKILRVELLLQSRNDVIRKPSI